LHNNKQLDKQFWYKEIVKPAMQKQLLILIVLYSNPNLSRPMGITLHLCPSLWWISAKIIRTIKSRYRLTGKLKEN